MVVVDLATSSAIAAEEMKRRQPMTTLASSSGPEQTIDGVPGNATEKLSGFLDRVERAVLHGATQCGEGEPVRMLFGHQGGNDC